MSTRHEGLFGTYSPSLYGRNLLIVFRNLPNAVSPFHLLLLLTTWWIVPVCGLLHSIVSYQHPAQLDRGKYAHLPRTREIGFVMSVRCRQHATLSARSYLVTSSCECLDRLFEGIGDAIELMFTQDAPRGNSYILRPRLFHSNSTGVSVFGECSEPNLRNFVIDTTHYYPAAHCLIVFWEITNAC